MLDDVPGYRAVFSSFEVWALEVCGLGCSCLSFRCELLNLCGAGISKHMTYSFVLLVILLLYLRYFAFFGP